MPPTSNLPRALAVGIALLLTASAILYVIYVPGLWHRFVGAVMIAVGVTTAYALRPGAVVAPDPRSRGMLRFQYAALAAFAVASCALIVLQFRRPQPDTGSILWHITGILLVASVGVSSYVSSHTQATRESPADPSRTS